MYIYIIIKKVENMKTISIDQVQFKNEQIKETVALMLQNGFKVFVYKAENVTDCTYSKDDKVAYLSVNNYGRIAISTIHKPNKNIGSGYGLTEDSYFDGIANPIIKDLETGFIIAPNWADSRDLSSIKKYTLNEWIEKKSQFILKHKQVTL